MNVGCLGPASVYLVPWSGTGLYGQEIPGVHCTVVQHSYSTRYKSAELLVGTLVQVPAIDFAILCSPASCRCCMLKKSQLLVVLVPGM